MRISQNRRDFLKISAAGALGMMAFGPFGCKPVATVDRKSFGVGLQLYTIRDAMAADVLGSLQKLSDLGFKNLELANYSDGKFYGYVPAEFKKIVNDLGMEVISSTHRLRLPESPSTMRKKWPTTCRLGVKYCVQPWVNEEDRNIESYKKMIATGTK
jgi:sugar phosphate isomerase/epimerase